ncbi:MAG: hypothetical protein ACE14L_07460 [Terriglobales bacterium]
MTTIDAIRSGISGTRRAAWMVFIFYGCNLLLAAAVAAPMYRTLADHIGHSAVGNELARGFSSSWLVEFQIAKADFLNSFSIAIAYAGILFLALNTVLSAGAFEVYRHGAGASMHAFGRGIGKYFGRFARIAVVASLFYFVAFWLWQGPAAALLNWIFRDSVPERWHFYLNWLRWALLFASVFVVNAVAEYAKAGVVIDEHPSALAAIGHGAGFVVAHFWRVMAIYCTLGALTTLTILVYAAFARYFPQSSVATVLIWFLVAQVLLWLRWMFRLSSWGAAVAYSSAHRPRRDTAEPSPAEAPAPQAMSR